MTYYVTYKIDARYTVKVEANSVKEALILADDEFIEEDFGAAKDIEGEAIYVCDDKDDFVWER